MGLLNSNQLLLGARKYGGDKTYTTTFIKDIPSYTVSGNTVSFLDGSLEVEGVTYPFAGKSLNFSSLGSLIRNGFHYVLAAVPTYNEPADKAAAEAAGLNYYIRNSIRNEGIATPFIPTALQGRVDLAGGWDEIQFKVTRGIASASDKALFNDYGEALKRLADPRYAVFPLRPINFGFVVAEVKPQNNYSSSNVFLTRDKAYFDQLNSQVGELYTDTRVETAAAADAFYADRYYLVKEAHRYSSLANAESRTGGVLINMSSGFTNFVATGGSHIVSKTYSYPSRTALGMEGNKPTQFRLFTKENSSVLGRVNPIYLDNPQATLRNISNATYSPLTRYADPATLVTVSAAVAGNGAITLTLVEENFETYLN